MNNCPAYLRLKCISSLPCSVCYAQLISEGGETVCRLRLCGDEYGTMEVPPGCYRLNITNASGLGPGCITKWLTLKAGQCAYIQPVFGRRSLRTAFVRVSLTLIDAAYPGLMPINGGMTIWKQQNTP